jgi:hypothetical protein
MKKTYIEPQAEVITIGVSSVICTSGLGLGDDTGTAGITDADSPEFDMSAPFEVSDFDNF